jgi:hypothetical protein
MKKLSVLMAVLVIAMVQARAANTLPLLNLSCTAQFNKSSTTNGTLLVATVTTESVNNKLVYKIITNAVAKLTNGMAAKLPANGYIAYDPYDSDGKVNGYFFVANKSGFHYPLSGYGTNDIYYSFIELDTQDGYLGDLGFANQDGHDMNYVFSRNINLAKGSGSEKDLEPALLYIHDNPYDYDDLDDPHTFDVDNQNSIEIRGLMQLTITAKGGAATLSGTGNINMSNGASQGVIVSGGASLK